MIRIIVLLAVIFAIDFYAFQAVKFVCRGLSFAKFIYIFYWLFTVFSMLVVLAGAFYDWQQWPKGFRTYAFALIFISSFSKFFIVIFLLADDLLRGVRYLWSKGY